MPTEPALAPARTPSRRHLLHGVAWATPAVAAAVAAPALAASCDRLDQVIDWDAAGRYVRNAARTVGVYTLPVSGQTDLVLTVRATWGPGGVMPESLGTPSNYGAVPGSLQLNTGNTSANATVVAFTFSRQVRNLRFTITDIDGLSINASSTVKSEGGNEWVSLDPAPTSSTITDSTYLIGTGRHPVSGKSGDPFRVRPNPGKDNPDNRNQSWGNVTVSYSSATTITYRGWNQFRDGAIAQWVSDMTFDLPCLA